MLGLETSLVHEYSSIDIDRVRRAIESQGYLRALQIIDSMQKKISEKCLSDP
ncbi:MAG: hypothetical protein RQ885_14325 [Desulfurococcales archaeon]|nr:hypothetical protein [Desulfurococcales archaeon]